MEELKKLELKKKVWKEKNGHCFFYAVEGEVLNVDFMAIDKNPSLLNAVAIISRNHNVDFTPRDTYTIGDAVRFWK